MKISLFTIPFWFGSSIKSVRMFVWSFRSNSNRKEKHIKTDDKNEMKTITIHRYQHSSELFLFGTVRDGVKIMIFIHSEFHAKWKANQNNSSSKKELQLKCTWYDQFSIFAHRTNRTLNTGRLVLLSGKSVVIHILFFHSFFWIAFSFIFRISPRNRYTIHAKLQTQSCLLFYSDEFLTTTCYSYNGEYLQWHTNHL